MPKYAGYGVGPFDMPSSRNFLPLDALLWAIARHPERQTAVVKDRLTEFTNLDLNFR